MALGGRVAMGDFLPSPDPSDLGVAGPRLLAEEPPAEGEAIKPVVDDLSEDVLLGLRKLAAWASKS